MTNLRKSTLLAALIIAGIAGITQPTLIVWSQGDGETAEPTEPEAPVAEEPSEGDETEPSAAPQAQQQQQQETFQASAPDLEQQLADRVSELEAEGAENISIECIVRYPPFSISCTIRFLEAAGPGPGESEQAGE